MKNIQNSLVGETNHPVGVARASRTGSVMRLFFGGGILQSIKKHLAHWRYAGALWVRTAYIANVLVQIYY